MLNGLRAISTLFKCHSAINVAGMVGVVRSMRRW